MYCLESDSVKKQIVKTDHKLSAISQTMLMNSSFADRLRQALAFRDVKQNDLEERAPLASGYASRLLSGQRDNPTNKTIKKIATFLRVRENWLANGEGSMVEPDDEIADAGDISTAPTYETSHEAERYDALPQWPHYVAYVKRKEPNMPTWPIERAGAARPFLVGLPTAETILQLCRFIEANDQPPGAPKKLSK